METDHKYTDELASTELHVFEIKTSLFSKAIEAENRHVAREIFLELFPNTKILWIHKLTIEPLI